MMLPRVLPALDTRLAGEITIRVEVTDGPCPPASAAATISGAPVVVRGTAAAVLCWLTGRPVPAPADLAASRRGQSWPLPQLRPWS